MEEQDLSDWLATWLLFVAGSLVGAALIAISTFAAVVGVLALILTGALWPLLVGAGGRSCSHRANAPGQRTVVYEERRLYGRGDIPFRWRRG